MFFTGLYRLSVFDRDGDLTFDDLPDAGQALRIAIDVVYSGTMPDIPEGWSSELVRVLAERKIADFRQDYWSLQEGGHIALRYDPG